MYGFAILARLAWQDMRRQPRQLRLLTACMILSIAVLACIGAVSQSIQSGIQRDAKSLLGGDVEWSRLYYPIAKEAQAYTFFSGTMSQVLETRTMAAAHDKRAMVE